MTRLPSPRARPLHSVFETDAGVVSRVARNDLDALGILYDRYAAELLRFANRVAAPDEAEDLVQLTFLRVLKIAGNYDEQVVSARPWLFAIAVRVMRERRRAFHRWGRALLRLTHGAEAAHGIDQATRGDAFEARSDLGRGLRRLSAAKRVVLILAEVEGFTSDEIARMLEIPVGTVWTRLHHARRELRTFCEGEKA